MYRKMIIMSSRAASSSASSMLLLDFFNRMWQYVANDSALKFEFFAFPVTAFLLTNLLHALSSAPLKPTSVLNCSRTIFAYLLWTESNTWMYFLGSYTKMNQMKFEISISIRWKSFVLRLIPCKLRSKISPFRCVLLSTHVPQKSHWDASPPVHFEWPTNTSIPFHPNEHYSTKSIT